MLEVWTVYENPTDEPGWFVARLFIGEQATTSMFKARTLRGLRALLPRGLYRMARQAGDEPHIVETWF